MFLIEGGSEGVLYGGGEHAEPGSLIGPGVTHGLWLRVGYKARRG
jgi:hypothetical protein